VNTSRKVNLDLIVICVSVALTLLSLTIASQLRAYISFGRELSIVGNQITPLLYITVALIWFSVLLSAGVTRLLRMQHMMEGLLRLFLALIICDLLCAGMLYLLFRDLSRLMFFYFIMLDNVVIVAFFLTMRAMVLNRQASPATIERVLIVGSGSVAVRIANAIYRQRPRVASVVGFLDNDPSLTGRSIQDWPVLGQLKDARQAIEEHQIDNVVIALSLNDHPAAIELVRELQALPVHIRLVPDFLDFAVIRSSVDYLEGMPIVGLRVPALSDEDRLYKRIFDVVVSSLLLIILLPVFALIAILIKLDSRGTVFWRAERVGENGKPFTMYKFRSMVADAEARWHEVISRDEEGHLRFKHANDPRITRVGAFLRRTSLDELPQLLNVLKGDMSLVGPRPELPLVVQEEYEPWQWSRFTVPQGMTGWWQINRRGFEHQHLCTADDLYYIQNYSLQLDLLILFKTIGVVIRGQGAY
jgi:exopolysaccharide biosynthesis polyprenyl glycosylphosphotransferase